LNFELFFQQLLNGLTIGMVYALIALGYTMVYGIIELINFAHGEVFMVGAFLSFTFLTIFAGWVAVTPFIAVLLALLVFSMLGCALVGAGGYFGFYRGDIARTNSGVGQVDDAR
jgi:branched-chain amino acid transport system permease protein